MQQLLQFFRCSELICQLSGLYNTLYKYGYVDLANEVKAVAIDEKILNIPVLFHDIEWFTTQKDASGKDVQVPNVAKYWYVESGVANNGNDSTLFEEKVWNAHADVYHNPKLLNADGTVKDGALNAGYRFTRAIVVALSPFSNIVNVLFNAGTGRYF